MATKTTLATARKLYLGGACHDGRGVGLHSASGRPGAGSRAVLRCVVHRRHGGRRRAQRCSQRRARSAQRGVGRAASQPLGHSDSRLEVHRGHRHGELSLHLASAEEPDMGLRRPAENGALRRPLAGPLEHHRLASTPRRASDVRAAGRPAATRRGERSRRHRRVGSRLPVPLHAGRLEGRRLPDHDGPRGHRCAAPVRRHAQRPAATGRAGQLVGQTDGLDHAAHRRQQQRRARDRQPARRGDHPAGRAAADRLPLRLGPDGSGEEGGDRPTRRPGGLAGGQRQPERRRRRGAARGGAVAGRRRCRSAWTGPCRTPLSMRWTTRVARR